MKEEIEKPFPKPDPDNVTFEVGEEVEIKGHPFKLMQVSAHGHGYLVFQPLKPGLQVMMPSKTRKQRRKKSKK
jgi:hypothetical protein